MWCVPAARRPAGVLALDPEPADGRSQGGRVLEALAVRLPRRGSPDLCVIASADDDGVGAEARHLPEITREQDAALAVERRLDGAGENEPREATCVLVGDRQGRDLLGEHVPAGPGMDREACVEPARDDEARVQLS